MAIKYERVLQMTLSCDCGVKAEFLVPSKERGALLAQWMGWRCRSGQARVTKCPSCNLVYETARYQKQRRVVERLTRRTARDADEKNYLEECLSYESSKLDKRKAIVDTITKAIARDPLRQTSVTHPRR